jgi:hypothetical protein
LLSQHKPREGIASVHPRTVLRQCVQSKRSTYLVQQLTATRNFATYRPFPPSRKTKSQTENSTVQKYPTGRRKDRRHKPQVAVRCTLSPPRSKEWRVGLQHLTENNKQNTPSIFQNNSHHSCPRKDLAFATKTEGRNSKRTSQNDLGPCVASVWCFKQFRERGSEGISCKHIRSSSPKAPVHEQVVCRG